MLFLGEGGLHEVDRRGQHDAHAQADQDQFVLPDALALDLGRYLLMGRGEEASGGRARMQAAVNVMPSPGVSSRTLVLAVAPAPWRLNQCPARATK